MVFNSIGGTLAVKITTLAALSVVLALTAIPSTAQFLPKEQLFQQQRTELVDNIYGYQLCPGQFALCEASICRPTGRMITVNGPNNTHPQYPEAECVCPILPGPSIADVNGGNMQGNCAPPGPHQVWSLYLPKQHLPQEINDWSRRPDESRVRMQICPGSLNLGQAFANCFSFACTIDDHPRNGVRTATCFCPLGENLDGTQVAMDASFVTPAGQCNEDVCGQYPVGANDKNAPSDQMWECLDPGNSDQH
jgi:hypothetical protein